MSTNTFTNENSPNTNGQNTSVITNDGPIAHLDHMLNSLHDESQSTGRISTLDPYETNKSHRIHPHQRSIRTNLTEGKIVECSSENAVVYRYYTGESTSIIDEHFDKVLKQQIPFNSNRAMSTRDNRTSSYAYPSMMSSSTSFWPNFMTPPTSYPHPTYLPTSQTEYTDWMHHHPSYRTAYSTTPSSAVSTSTSVNASTSNMSNNHLHSMGSPTNSSRYHHHHHSTSDMDVVTAAAIGAAAAAQMFHEKQTHHGYTSATHFDYHLGGSMIPSASYAFPSQSFDLMSSTSTTMPLDNSNMKDPTTSNTWYSNHHLSC